MSRQINGIYIHTMEYSLALKRKILTRATTWVKTEDILVNEISQMLKGQLLYEEQRVVKFTETESRMVVSRTGREMGLTV